VELWSGLMGLGMSYYISALSSFGKFHEKNTGRLIDKGAYDREIAKI